MNKVNVGEHLISLLGITKTNLATVAKETKIPLSTLYDLCTREDVKQIKFQNLCTLADYFNVTERELIYGKDKKKRFNY